MTKQLLVEFKKKGVSYKQIEKNERYVIYQCTRDNDTYYEVFKYTVKNYPSYFSNGNKYKYAECYPSDEEFGKWAWCCNTMNRVKAMIDKHNL